MLLLYRTRLRETKETKGRATPHLTRAAQRHPPMQRHIATPGTSSPAPNKHSDAQGITTPILHSQPARYDARNLSTTSGRWHLDAVAVSVEKEDVLDQGVESRVKSEVETGWRGWRARGRLLIGKEAARYNSEEEAGFVALLTTLVGPGVRRSRSRSNAVGTRSVPEHLIHRCRLERQPTELIASLQCFDQRHFPQRRWVANIFLEHPDVAIVMAASEKNMHAAGVLDELAEGT